MLHHYNRLISIAWLANYDFSPYVTTEATASYIVKYASKEEEKSVSLHQIMTTVRPQISADKPLMSFTVRTLNQLVGKRDISAQEVARHNLSLPLSKGSRTIVTVDCRPKHLQKAPIELDDEAQNDGGNGDAPNRRAPGRTAL
ncbi:unnamed protein product [Zymoseptoria tritici ST99CH_1E4]|uniref:Uncharacterized protein n=1 Tax=Zymoseptoria tritici ST99CH_1E4 TaxID=1276532 RepID=A0A2H1FYX3_ZYMTR|nr:unnamed protein product [Zymoseptoria tritici ST99CH_1E4]